MKTYALTNPYQHGDDLKQLQAALKADHFYNGPIDGIFGEGTGHGCIQAKYRFGYPRSQCTATGGQQLLDYLKGNKGLPAAYKVRRRARGYGISKAAKLRQVVVGHALWGVANNRSINYAQVRPMDCLNSVRHLPWTCDCSEFVTTIFKWAGAPDPNGNKFNGYGFTGTMLDHGISIGVAECKPADVVIWGSYPGHHTAVVVEVNKNNRYDPMLVSMGQDSDPRKISLAAETSAQRGRPVTVKRYITGG